HSCLTKGRRHYGGRREQAGSRSPSAAGAPTDASPWSRAKELQRKDVLMPIRAAVMPTLGVIEVQDVPAPTISPQQAIVKIEAVGVCGSDTAYYRVGYIGDWKVEGPIILGHEAAGTVLAVGEDVTGVSVGARVAIEPGTPCRRCHECMAGRYHL